MSTTEMVLEEVLEGSSLACNLCYMSSKPEGVKLGGMYQFGELVAHHFCLIMASGLAQNGEDEEGILGFLTSDIERELRRGFKLKCYLCKKNNATVGCCVKTCLKSFHLPCCLASGGLCQFFGNFNTYCCDHRPKQRVPECYWKRDISSSKIKSFKPGPTKLVGQCGVCLDRMPLKPGGYSSLWTPCCKGWFHRKCIEAMADVAGCHFVKCPLCNNKEVFEKEMLRYGIYIPDRDAKWETDENAFEDLYIRHSSCDTDVCLCPEGREHNVVDTDFELILCELCGSQGVHVMCAGLDPVNLRWKCDICLGAIKHKQIKEIEKKIDAIESKEKAWIIEHDSTDEEEEEETKYFSDSEVFEKCFQGNDTRIWSAITSICKIDVKKIDLEHTHIANKDDVMKKKSKVDINMVISEDEQEKEDSIDVFNCEECNFDCDSKEGLNRHMKLHDPSREFPCDECGLRFVKERHVNIHARLHTGEKPFRCDLCSTNFAESWSLKLHMSKHDPRRKFACDLCTLRFKSIMALKVHVERQHSEKSVEIKHNSKCESSHECGKDSKENDVQPSTSSSAFFGGGKLTSVGLAWLDSVKRNSGRSSSRCSESESQGSDSARGQSSRGGSASLRDCKSREGTLSPNIEEVGWRKNKPKIKIYHPMTSKLKSSPESLDHNYSSGPDDGKSRDYSRTRKLSKEFLESKDDLVKPFTLKIKKSNRSWLDERSESDGEDADGSIKKMRLEWSEESNEGIDYLQQGNSNRKHTKSVNNEGKDNLTFSLDYEDKPRTRRSTKERGVRVSLDDDDKVWCLKMENVLDDADKSLKKTSGVKVAYKSPNSLIVDKDIDDDVSVLSPCVKEVKDEEIIDLLSESDDDENETLENKDPSGSDDFSISSEEPPDPIDDLLDDSGSDNVLTPEELSKAVKDPTENSVNGGPSNSSKHVTDHDYVKDDSEDETCSEYEDLFVSDHEDS